MGEGTRIDNSVPSQTVTLSTPAVNKTPKFLRWMCLSHDAAHSRVAVGAGDLFSWPVIKPLRLFGVEWITEPATGGPDRGAPSRSCQLQSQAGTLFECGAVMPDLEMSAPPTVAGSSSFFRSMPDRFFKPLSLSLDFFSVSFSCCVAVFRGYCVLAVPQGKVPKWAAGNLCIPPTPMAFMLRAKQSRLSHSAYFRESGTDMGNLE
jgi:hypothetical protein